MPCFFLYNQGLSHTLASAQTLVFEQVSGHFRIKEHYIHDVGTEELAHLEIVGSLVHQLTKNLSTSEIERSPMAAYYVDHSKGVFPASAAGNPWKAEYIGVKGDPIADLVEDLAAEQKARVTYDNILKFCDNPDVTQVIKFLRQREVVHFQRFGECLNKIQENVKAKKVQGCGIKDM